MVVMFSWLCFLPHKATTFGGSCLPEKTGGEKTRLYLNSLAGPGSGSIGFSFPR